MVKTKSPYKPAKFGKNLLCIGQMETKFLKYGAFGQIKVHVSNQKARPQGDSPSASLKKQQEAFQQIPPVCPWKKLFF